MVTQTLERDRVDEAVAALLDEFRGVYSPETIWRCADDTSQQVNGSRILDFVPLLVYRFTRERLSARGQVEGLLVKSMPEVLFVCTHNAGRSQMAAVLTHVLSDGRVHVRSAGTTPGDDIHPRVVQAIEEIGLDLSQGFPKPLTDEVVQAADVVVTMGCGDACEVYPGKKYLNWELPDPAGQPIEVVRELRDDIRTRVEALLRDLGVEPVAIG